MKVDSVEAYRNSRRVNWKATGKKGRVKARAMDL